MDLASMVRKDSEQSKVEVSAVDEEIGPIQ